MNLLLCFEEQSRHLPRQLQDESGRRAQGRETSKLSGPSPLPVALPQSAAAIAQAAGIPMLGGKSTPKPDVKTYLLPERKPVVRE